MENKSRKKIKVAIVHYWFITRRGGEKVVESILKLYPEADVYTLFYDKKMYGKYLRNHKVYTSSFNNVLFRKYYQKMFPFYPQAIKSLKLQDDYDLIISSESGPAKGIKINNKAKHICYIHSPMRYCWGFTQDYIATVKPLLRPIVNFFFKRLKSWDRTTIDNVDLYIANSKNVQKRVEKFYSKTSKVIYPPIASSLFEGNLFVPKKKLYFLSFGAITPYKKIDLLIDCFNENGEKLIIIGTGTEKKRLKAKANSNIEFKGFLEDDNLKEFIQNSRALLFPGEEDFGMIPLEVMSYGLPVIAFRKGGALETVTENLDDFSLSSGIFFDEQKTESLQEAIKLFKSKENEFDSEWIRTQAKNFEESKFLYSFSREVNNILE